MVDDPGSAICPIEFRYGRETFRALFSRDARLRRALRVEAALALAEVDAGIVPAEAGRAIERAASDGSVTVARVDELERELKHDVMAITRALAERAGPGSGWVHYGATSGDITDTALGLEHQEALGVIRDDLTELGRVLLALAERHRATPEVGRTHGQHAVPISFGYKAAVAASEVLRHRDRLDQLRPRVAVGKISGAVGTGAGFGPKAEEIEAGVMRRLGLTADGAPTQIVGRDRIAEMTNLLALIAGTAERLSTEVRNLQRSEIGEVIEAFEEGRQVGSSTMAQKRNPMLSENIASLARLIRAFALTPLENMVLWHERDLTNSANERIVLPHALVLTDDILVKLADLFAHLEVHPERMAANLDLSKGGIMAENLILALTRRGVARSEAHEWLRQLTRSGTGGPTLLESARAHSGIRGKLSEEELRELVDPAAYVHAAAVKTDRIVASLRSTLAP